MKKFGALVLTAAMAFALVACGSETTESTPESSVEESVATQESSVEESEAVVEESSTEESSTEEAVAVMSYADYVAAELDSDVVIEAYVQATQSWWDNKITVYLQDQDGAYFAYNMACSEEDAAKLVPGTKIRVTGYKTEWSGEVEIAEGATFEFVEGDTFVAEPVDVTDLLGTDALVEKQNQKVAFKDMTVSAVSYKNNEPGDDIYVNFTKDGAEYAFCLEYYLNGSDEEFYNAVGSLEVGQVCDVEGFLYWYEGPNPHITAVTVK